MDTFLSCKTLQKKKKLWKNSQKPRESQRGEEKQLIRGEEILPGRPKFTKRVVEPLKEDEDILLRIVYILPSHLQKHFGPQTSRMQIIVCKKICCFFCLLNQLSRLSELINVTQFTCALFHLDAPVRLNLVCDASRVFSVVQNTRIAINYT